MVYGRLLWLEGPAEFSSGAGRFGQFNKGYTIDAKMGLTLFLLVLGMNKLGAGFGRLTDGILGFWAFRSSADGTGAGGCRLGGSSSSARLFKLGRFSGLVLLDISFDGVKVEFSLRLSSATAAGIVATRLARAFNSLGVARPVGTGYEVRGLIIFELGGNNG